MSYTKKLHNNIFNNYIFIFLSNLNLTHGLWMIYLATKGMSLVQLGLLEGIFHITSFLMEVPTGLVADIYGRKTSRIIGRIFALLSIFLLLTADSFIFFTISFIFIALSYNLESGAGEALIYDSLKELKLENKYMKICGKQEIAVQVGQVIAFIIGGYLATIDYKYVFYLTMIFIVITIIQSFIFQEPNIDKEETKNNKLSKILKNQINQSINIIKDNRKIGFFIIFTQIILAFGTSLFYYLQNFLIADGHTEFFIGVIFSISAIFDAIAGSLTFRLEKIIKEKGILMIMPFLSVICIWFIALSKYSYIFYIIMCAIEGFIFVAMSDYINRLIPSKNRATILSLASMVFSFFMIFIFPLIGKIGDLYSLKTAFLVLAIIATIFAIGNFILLLNINKKKDLPKT
ncbi:MAG: MFS transporter [Sphaerochaetaceae bacterium]|nr:MFS transporter [Sphaerochaetaceae bacterium]